MKTVYHVKTDCGEYYHLATRMTQEGVEQTARRIYPRQKIVVTPTKLTFEEAIAANRKIIEGTN